MLKKISLLLFCFIFILSCASIELPKVNENSSIKNIVYSTILFNSTRKIDQDRLYLVFSKLIDENEFMIPNDVSMDLYIEGDTSLYYFRKDNKKHKNLLIISSGGAFISVIKNNRLSVYVEDYLKKLDNFDVLVVDYHMGLQFNYPIQNIDLINAYKLGLKMDYSNKEIYMLGDSSGGNIIASSVLYLKNNNFPTPEAVVLLSPYLDATNSVDSRTRNLLKDVVFGTDSFNYKNNLGYNMPYFLFEKNLENEYISPIFASNLKNFPKTLIQVSDTEILEDDSILFYNKLKKDGVDTTLEIYKSQIHAFQTLNIDESRKAREKIVEYLQKISSENENIDFDKLNLNEINKINFNVKMNKNNIDFVKKRLSSIGIDFDFERKYEIELYKRSKRAYLIKR